MTALLFALRPCVRSPALHGSRAVGVGFRIGACFLPIALLAITGACDSRPAHSLLGPVPELLTRIEVVEEHESCPAGATVVESGFDGDEDGELGDDEVSTTEVLCTEGRDPCDVEERETSLVIRCPGEEPVEVDRTRPGEEPWLVVITAGAPDEECPAGGFTVRSGHDAVEGDGVLDPDEVESTEYLCHPYCGDETIDAGLGEECDDGNGDPGDGCDEACRVEPSCMPPEPDPACPPAGYHVEVTLPSVISTAGGALTLQGAFPEDATVSDVRVVVQGTETPLEVTGLSATELALEVPPGVGFLALEVSVAGWSIPYWVKEVGLDGVLTVHEEDAVSLRYATPIVTSASGCVNAGSATEDCPAAGGSVLTLTGSHFGTDATQIAVFVAGSPCSSVTIAVPHTSIQCELPPRAGAAFDLPVEVDVAGQKSSPLALVSYEGPEILGGTLRVGGGAAGPDAELPDTDGGHVVAFDALGLDGVDAEVVQVEFRRGDYHIACTEPAVTPVGGDAFEVECAIASGVGQDLVPLLGVAGVSSRPGTDRLHHPVPELEPGSLRTDPGGVGTDELMGTRSGGELIYFDALHLGQDPGNLRVTLGTLEDPERYGCGNLHIDGSAVRCTTSFGTGGPYELTVHLPGGGSVRSTDTFTYPAAPRVTSVSGCFDVGGTTVACPTSGGPTLTIAGESFGADVWVDVGGVPCNDLVRLGPTSLTCTLPPGVGEVDVVVGEGNLRSEGFAVEYAHPSITRVSGCAVQDGNTTGGCTEGLQVLIEGHNFGAGGATVLVGSSLCAAVQHDSITPHGLLRCTLPPGSGTQPLHVVSGHVSESFAIHYTAASN